MSDTSLYFEGDPEKDSARRHMERVLKQAAEPPSRWPWILGLLVGGGSWAVWRSLRKNYPDRQPGSGVRS
jgi:hypothetical protein